MIQDTLVGSLIGVSATLVIAVGVLIYLIIWIHRRRRSQGFGDASRFSYEISPSNRDSVIPDDFLPGQMSTLASPTTDLPQPLAPTQSKEKGARSSSLMYKNRYHLQRLSGQIPNVDPIATPRTFTRTTSWILSRLSAANLSHVVAAPRRPRPEPIDTHVYAENNPTTTPIAMFQSPLPPWTKQRPNSILITHVIEEEQVKKKADDQV
ncbi:hypothetical protein K493DRAFT_352423 [Basidiobolus meristosporus CBS 931.73]|uniref:Uncharacterized protein n=1 Tax=Basidiobolus meristosporus CBS 931.73 TaxID=1314790 RepID=A0A1Y1Y961_9FUNG|nr:hypothetical protein K493DRAFT_352423 [Basidiobolus meristosporus CBS 931.73]|eukprot:ORX94527.1 hypothetical protein K493DRAFT_352423 [Basidiobolus meristosporus CBS 931.73]